MSGYYKRETSLMDTTLYPRRSLDIPIENPDTSNSTGLSPSEKNDQDIINNVVSSLNKMRIVQTGKE